MCVARAHDPEYLDVRAVARAWLDNGGTATNLIVMVAIAQAESSFNRFAQGDACDTGLWQVIEAHAYEYGVHPEDLYDPRVNAGIAVALSQDGTHLSPWCTAYAHPRRDCGTYALSYPEEGSAARYAIANVAALLGVSGGDPAPLPPGGVTVGDTPVPIGPPPGLVLPPIGAPGQPIFDVTYPTLPPYLTPPVSRDDGWDNIAYYVSRDIPALTQYDVALVKAILR